MRSMMGPGVVLLAGGLVLAEPPRIAEAARINKAKIDLLTLTKACDTYKLKHGEYPSSLAQLVKPPSGRPYFESEKALKDPWGARYRYDAEGKHNDGLRPDIWTVAPDKREIGNWPDEKKPDPQKP